MQSKVHKNAILHDFRSFLSISYEINFWVLYSVLRKEISVSVRFPSYKHKMEEDKVTCSEESAIADFLQVSLLP